MKKILMIKLIKIFSASLILLLSIELGLYLREYRKNATLLKIDSYSENNILLIGDSVMGDIENPNSVAAQLNNKLLQENQKKLKVYNLSEPALSSWTLNQKIDDYLKKYNPLAVIIMLGNSDYIIRQDSDKLINNFYEKVILNIQTLKTVQFVQKYFSFNKIEKSTNKTQRGRFSEKKEKVCEVNNEIFKANPNIFFWNCVDSKNNLKALENFEEILKIYQPNIRMMLRAKDIYIQLDLQKRGIEFFSTYIKTTKDRYLAKVSQFIIGELSGYSQPTDVQIIDQKITDRNAYLSRLMYLKKKSMNSEANQLFQNLDSIPVFEDHLPDFVSLNSVIQKILNKNIQVFLVQYPNQLLWTLELAGVKGARNLHYIDLYQSVKVNLNKYSVNQIFEDDFLHVTELGAKIVADKMSQIFMDQMKEEENESN